MHCGRKLKAVMAQKGYSGAELGRKIGRGRQQVWRWCHQERFSMATIMLLAKALEIDPEEFFL